MDQAPSSSQSDLFARFDAALQSFATEERSVNDRALDDPMVTPRVEPGTRVVLTDCGGYSNKCGSVIARVPMDDRDPESGMYRVKLDDDKEPTCVFLYQMLDFAHFAQAKAMKADRDRAMGRSGANAFKIKRGKRGGKR